MERESYRYRFADAASMQDVEETLLLSVIATEALHGRSKVNLDARFQLDNRQRTCEVDASNEVGRDIARIFTGLLTSQMGEDAFKVKRAALSHAVLQGAEAHE